MCIQDIMLYVVSPQPQQQEEAKKQKTSSSLINRHSTGIYLQTSYLYYINMMFTVKTTPLLLLLVASSSSLLFGNVLSQQQDNCTITDIACASEDFSEFFEKEEEKLRVNMYCCIHHVVFFFSTTVIITHYSPHTTFSPHTRTLVSLLHYTTATLCDALSLAGLEDDLSSDEWTVFAPTDLAFEALGIDNIHYLWNDTVALTQLLLFHVVPSAMRSSEFVCEAGINLITMANGLQTRT
jgi:desulfoferrodoxin (superoxide reductase-like protein)